MTETADRVRAYVRKNAKFGPLTDSDVEQVAELLAGYAASERSAIRKLLPELYFSDRELEFRIQILVHDWQRAVESNKRLEAERGECYVADRFALRCPACPTGKNSKDAGGNKRCFHCGLCGFVECEWCSPAHEYLAEAEREAQPNEWQVELAKVTGLGHTITPNEAADYIVEAMNKIYELREKLESERSAGFREGTEKSAHLLESANMDCTPAAIRALLPEPPQGGTEK